MKIGIERRRTKIDLKYGFRRKSFPLDGIGGPWVGLYGSTGLDSVTYLHTFIVFFFDVSTY